MEHTKSYNNRGGKNRLRFTSSKSRGKSASADIYRAHVGNHLTSTSSTAIREKRVHDGSDAKTKRKKSKNEDYTVRFFEKENDSEGFGIGRSAVIVPGGPKGTVKTVVHDDVHDRTDDEENTTELFLTGGTEFLSEIEISGQRNGSQVFHKLIGEMKPLCKSFAELLHHKGKIVNLLCEKLLDKKSDAGRFVANVATNDILHLIGVLARELRTELYPFLSTKLFPRIIDDMLNSPSVTITPEGQQYEKTALDVAHVEAAFRCLSYLFKYNSEELINSQEGEHGDADSLRQHYGKTICHKRDIVRKLACEAYAPLLRKCSDKGLKRHLMRTVKALATSLTNAELNAQFDDGNKSKNNMSSSMKRARIDAIDGVSSLMFEVARGAKRVHSKTGRVVIRSLMDCLIGYGNAKKGNDVKSVSSEASKAQVVYEVASQCLYKLRGHIVKGKPLEEHIEPSVFGGGFDEIHKALDMSICILNENSSGLVISRITTGHIVDLITEMVKFQDGRLIQATSTKNTECDRITKALQSLLSNEVFSKADRTLEKQTLRLMCSTWRVKPNHPSFSMRLVKYFPQIISPAISDDEGPNLDPAIFLSRNLLPFLPQKLASDSLIPSLLSAAASPIGKRDDTFDDSLVLLHSIATVSWPSDESNDLEVDPDDAIADMYFSTKVAEQLPTIPFEVRSALVDMCLKDYLKEDTVMSASLIEQMSRVGFVVRCLPFLVCLGCSTDESNDDLQHVEITTHNEITRVLKWYVTMTEYLSSNKGLNQNIPVLQGLVLESFSKVMVECHNRQQSTKFQSLLRKTIAKIKMLTNSLLFEHPKSCCVIRGVAAFVTNLQIIEPGSVLNDCANETFELLVTNLAQPDHFIRLYTLQILESYPTRPFVTDHADLDLTDDLEEGPSYKSSTNDNGSELVTGKSELGGPCDIISLMRKLESIPVAFANERKLTSQIHRVEVYANTSKLPALYAEAAVCHMLGLLNVKFAPIWPAVVRVIVALTTTNKDSTWPYLYDTLQQSLQKPSPNVDKFQKNAMIDEQNDAAHTEIILKHYSHCIAWEQSSGTSDIFSPPDGDDRQTISRHKHADELTLFQNKWSIMISAQNLVTTKSNQVVPLFFEFMIDQYYVFYSDDPDMREIKLSELVDSRVEWKREELAKKPIQSKLECFLKMFAAIKGPQQLFKHHIVLQMLIGFLSNPDAKTANLAFMCVQKFKLSYLTPYVDTVKSMLKKDEMRDALAKFDLSIYSESVDAEHRLLLIPIVTRVLFGRFQSRGGKSKTSRDSPAARRAAILSFFSRMGNNDGELTYFIYMMTRAFIPSSRQFDHKNLTSIQHIDALVSINSENIAAVPIPRQVGFLNLLSDVINQIGYGVFDAVPIFMNLLLSISEKAQEALIAKDEVLSIKLDSNEDDESSEENKTDNTQISRIRTLTFLRLGELLTKFASSTADFCIYGGRIWEAMSCSLVALPNTVINAKNPPSILRLIESISSQPKLIPLLNHDKDVMICTFKCIAGTTRYKVMDSLLHIIDNLLNVEDMIGQCMILQHVHLLISQFNERLTSKITKSEEIEDHSESRERFNSTEGLQLNILCRLSELLLNDQSEKYEHIQTMESLCGLLIPSLNFRSHPSQEHLMRTVTNFIPRLSAESAKSHYHALSKLLGPNKSNPGISSSKMRQMISTALCAVGNVSPELNNITQAVNDLNAFSHSHIDEYDFERMLPILNQLGTSSGNKGSWIDLCHGDPRLLFPLLYSSLHMLHSSDAVVGRASNKALKTLITTCAEQLSSKRREQIDLSRNAWMQFIEKTILPCLKIGLTTKADDIRRHFILLISHVARHFSSYESPHLYGDLNALIRDDDQDLDFFLNVTHLQLHRRVKALQRLRKMIYTNDADPPFSQQSFGNILLPLALHPIYECSSKAEDTFAVEAIATVGAITSHVPWGKYNETLQSVLNSLTRRRDNERHLIALLCAIIDSFHFRVEAEAIDSEGKLQAKNEGNGVWRSLKNRIIPKVEAFLLKENTDKRGSTSKSIRPSVVLALVKLFQKLPTETFEAKLPQLIKIISTTLKNKDSNERDVARETMAKIASILDMKYLPVILSDIAITLSHGYQLHVRAATLHSIIVAISAIYKPSIMDSNSVNEYFCPSFDRCLPAMLDLIQQDVFGTLSEMKESEYAEKRLIKEAMGSKSQDSLEIISKLILFKPSIATSEDRTKSSAHLLVGAFITRLSDPEVIPSTIRKVKDCLNKIAIGLSNNPSARLEEILPFIYATITPFVLGKVQQSNLNDDLENSDEDSDTNLKVTNTGNKESMRKKTAKAIVVKVSTWAPSTLDALENQRSALEMKKIQKRKIYKVTDGVTAPKLTGSLRHNPMQPTTKLLNNPANASALVFGLTLLNLCLKRFKLDASDRTISSMADPYLHLLLRYIQFSKDANGIVLSLRCLGSLLRINLRSVQTITNELSPILLEHLTAWGAASNTQTDIVQGCFKALNLLFLHPNTSISKPTPSTETASGLPLTLHQMQVLISLLQSAVMESEHHNATFGLVKTICLKKYISPEFYDLMDIILKLSVQSHKPSVRLQSSQIFLQYLLDYPMGTQRLDNHLKQLVLNLKYEHEEGRLSAIQLLSSIIQKLPLLVLEKHSQLFFLPSVLQLANDDSKKCAEFVADAISLLLTRLSTDTSQSFFNYVSRWSQSSGDDGQSMRQAAAQLYGIFVESRPDIIKRGNTAADMITNISNVLQEYIPFSGNEGWELLYYNILCIEKLNKDFQSMILAHDDIGASLIKLMAYPHPWVMQVSLRIINSHTGDIDPKNFIKQRIDSYLLKNEGCLYEIARNLCRQLDVEDVHFVEALSALTIKTIVWLFQVMNHHPNLFYSINRGLERDESNEESKNPCRWMMSRLSNIAKPKHGAKRRESIFKCYAALCTSCKPIQLTPYLRLMITSLDRAIREETNNLKSDERQSTHPSIAFPKDILNLLEDVCGTEDFIKAYTEVTKKVHKMKDQRKQDIAAEAVYDPASAAKRKIKKQLHEKERKKRRVNEMKLLRGVSRKNMYS